MRLGIYGGTFDPVHYGHLLVAESCRESLQLDAVWFVPAHQPPHKLNRTLSPAEQRARMLRLATDGHPNFHVSRVELDKQGTSYTVDTLKQIRETHRQAEMFLLLGADSLHDFPTWRAPEEICRLAMPVVVHRGGTTPPDLQVLRPLVPDDLWHRLSQYQVEMPIIEISSSAIRERVRNDRSIRYRTTAAVEHFILEHGLYRNPTPRTT